MLDKLLKRTDTYYGGAENVVITWVDKNLELIYETVDSNDGTTVKMKESDIVFHHYTNENNTNTEILEGDFVIDGNSLEVIYTDSGLAAHPNLKSSSTNDDTGLRTVTYNNGDSFTVAQNGTITKL